MTISKVLCAWCGRLISGPWAVVEPCPISHGICPECAVKVFGEAV